VRLAGECEAVEHALLVEDVDLAEDPADVVGDGPTGLLLMSNTATLAPAPASA